MDGDARDKLNEAWISAYYLALTYPPLYGRSDRVEVHGNDLPFYQEIPKGIHYHVSWASTSKDCRSAVGNIEGSSQL